MIIYKIKGGDIKQISLNELYKMSELVFHIGLVYSLENKTGKRFKDKATFSKFKLIKWYEERYQYEEGYMYIIQKPKWKK